MSKFTFLFFVVLMVSAQKISAQKIFMYKTGFNVIYLLNDTTELSTKQTASVLFTHPQAYGKFKTARIWQTVSTATGSIGTAMVAIPLVTYAFGEKSDWGLLIFGRLLATGGLVSNWVFKSYSIDAIDLYNADLPQKSSRIKPEFQFYGTGARLTIKF